MKTHLPLIGLLAATLSLHSEPLTVLTNTDSGPGSLRQALLDAVTGDAIVFDDSLRGQTILLTSGMLSVTKSISIAGPSPDLLAIDALGGSVVFRVADSTSAQLEVNLSGLTLRGGASGAGGGIHNLESLTLENCVLADNQASTQGGGVYNNAGALRIINCVLIGNRTVNSGTDRGGAVYNNRGNVLVYKSALIENRSSFGAGIENTLGTVQIINSTFSGNEALNGGGIFNNSGLTTLIQSTFALNRAAGSLGSGAGVHSGSGSMLAIANSIAAGNSFGAVASDIFSQGILVSNGANFIGATTGISNPSGLVDLTFASTGSTLDDLLDVGLTAEVFFPPFHALVQGSSAIDRGLVNDALDPSGEALLFDQRGASRVIGVSVDIGAIEFEAAAAPDTDGDGVPDSEDNCPETFNPSQEDRDQDGIGDVCDACPNDADNDADGDGVCGDEDLYPSSRNVGGTVVIAGCDSGVPNLIFTDGATINDLIDAIAADARNHGQFVRGVARLKNSLRKEGHLTPAEAEAIQNCAAESAL